MCYVTASVTVVLAVAATLRPQRSPSVQVHYEGQGAKVRSKRRTRITLRTTYYATDLRPFALTLTDVYIKGRKTRL